MRENRRREAGSRVAWVQVGADQGNRQNREAEKKESCNVGKQGGKKAEPQGRAEPAYKNAGKQKLYWRQIENEKRNGDIKAQIKKHFKER